jgi:cell wall assembly regulator SMI1
MLAQAVSLFGPEAREVLGYPENSGAGMIDRMKREVASYQAEAEGDRASLAHIEFRLDRGVWKYLAGPAHEESEEYRQKLTRLVEVCDTLTEEMQNGVYSSLGQLEKTKTRRFVAVYRGKRPPRPRQTGPVYRAPAPDALAALRAELQALDNALRTDDPLLFDCLHPAASPENISALARAIGTSALPDELAEWFRWHDGETPTRDPVRYAYGNAPRLWNGTNWTMLSAKASAAAWKSMKKIAAGDLEQPWSIAWIPLFERASGDYTVFDASPAGYGTIRSWWHDDETEIVASDLCQFLSELQDMP